MPGEQPNRFNEFSDKERALLGAGLAFIAYDLVTTYTQEGRQTRQRDRGKVAEVLLDLTQLLDELMARMSEDHENAPQVDPSLIEALREIARHEKERDDDEATQGAHPWGSEGA